ncbi:hypothetical protein [Fangia hongkongensis]|uniref:hypothetical protein n=2 Tax=Fangia hongkongensis TaxID=270495 RepID=UPI0003806E69|nr:hypothetical protein [Fangia hongkongensis]
MIENNTTKIPTAAVNEIDTEPQEYSLLDQALYDYIKDIADKQKELTDKHLKFRTWIGSICLFIFTAHIALTYYYEFSGFMSKYSQNIVGTVLMVNAIITLAISSLLIATYIRFPDISSKSIKLFIQKRNQ